MHYKVLDDFRGIISDKYFSADKELKDDDAEFFYKALKIIHKKNYPNRPLSVADLNRPLEPY